MRSPCVPDPHVGGRYADDSGRTLLVEEVEPTNPDGREVRGQIQGADDPPDVWARYATSLAIFDAIWTDEPANAV
jgi:hypothetical protein